MTIYKKFNLRHIYIKTAFLHRSLVEEVHIHYYEGYVNQVKKIESTN